MAAALDDDGEAATTARAMQVDERVLLSVPMAVSAPTTLVHVEVCLRALCSVDAAVVTTKVSSFLRQHRAILLSEQLAFEADKELAAIVQHARVHVPETSVDTVFFDDAELDVHVYQLNEDGAAEELADSEEDIAACQTYTLPASEFEGVWESLVYEDDTKRRLLNYARTAMLFSDRNVDANLIAWNRIILLFGPPGTGKTSLCKGIAQKLSIRLSRRYQHAQFVEINAHSLFSKWFSESGKLVLKLFQRINDLVDDDSSLVFVLIDEVESLAAARHAALSGSEPSDSIRAVNALLTQLDQLKSKPNVIVFTTSNISKAIDLAFVDRADMKMYIGPPVLQARVRILRTCMDELVRVGIVPRPEGVTAGDDDDDELNAVAALAEGLSGRALRRLPFQAHAMFLNEGGEQSTVQSFYAAMRRAIQYELETQQKTSLQHSN